MRATHGTCRKDGPFPPVSAAIQSTSSPSISRRAREEVTSKESEAARAAEETNRLRLQLGLEQQKVNDAEVSQENAKKNAFSLESPGLRQKPRHKLS